MRVEDAFDLCDSIGVQERFVAGSNDHFGLRSIEVAARVGDHAIASGVPRPEISLTDDVMKGHRGGIPANAMSAGLLAERVRIELSLPSLIKLTRKGLI